MDNKPGRFSFVHLCYQYSPGPPLRPSEMIALEIVAAKFQEEERKINPIFVHFMITFLTQST